jgi:hypothetical protein
MISVSTGGQANPAAEHGMTTDGMAKEAGLTARVGRGRNAHPLYSCQEISNCDPNQLRSFKWSVSRGGAESSAASLAGHGATAAATGSSAADDPTDQSNRSDQIDWEPVDGVLERENRRPGGGAGAGVNVRISKDLTLIGGWR